MPLTFDMPLEQLKTYQGQNPRPDNFDTFWDKSIAKMQAVDPHLELVPAKFQTPFAECSHMYFTGVDGARIHAKLLQPRQDTAPHPAATMIVATIKTLHGIVACLLIIQRIAKSPQRCDHYGCQFSQALHARPHSPAVIRICWLDCQSDQSGWTDCQIANPSYIFSQPLSEPRLTALAIRQFPLQSHAA